jgi:NTE family protein
MGWLSRKSATGALRLAVRKLREFAYSHQPTGTKRRLASSRPRIGLALGGGFARGVAHIGVLKALVENEIPIDAIAGASAGSVIGAVFASGATLEEMIGDARNVRWRSLARWTLTRMGLATNERMESMLRNLLHCSRFEELTIPLAVVATDISTGEPVIFRKGELIPALRASCSVPGLFTPVNHEGRLLVDGSILWSVPTPALRDFAVDRIIAVQLDTNGQPFAPTNMFQVVGQSFHIAQSLNEGAWRDRSDVVIEADVTKFDWDDFEHADELVRLGERAVLKALPAIRQLFETQPLGQVPRPVPAR